MPLFPGLDAAILMFLPFPSARMILRSQIHYRSKAVYHLSCLALARLSTLRVRVRVFVLCLLNFDTRQQGRPKSSRKVSRLYFYATFAAERWLSCLMSCANQRYTMQTA